MTAVSYVLILIRTALPKEVPAYKPEAAPVRRRQPLVRSLWQEERDSAPCFTFHLRPRVVQYHHPSCKLLCCLSGKPTPTVSRSTLRFLIHFLIYIRLTLSVHIFVMQVKWFKGTRELSRNDYTMTHSDGVVTLEILDCKPEDSGKYRCVATNPLGTDETVCVVIVEGDQWHSYT
jgi:hypothetical protein